MFIKNSGKQTQTKRRSKRNLNMAKFLHLKIISITEMFLVKK